MSVIDTFPIARLTSGALAPVGVDMVVASAGVDLPEASYGEYVVALHDDGSHCPPADCGCVDIDARTSIREGYAITRGEWTWHGARYALIGWRRSGPSEAEAELRKRAEVLAEGLEAERANHATTNADLVACIRRMERLQGSLDATSGHLESVRASLRLASEVGTRTERQRRRACWVALAGWTAAAVALVLAVVA